MTHFPKSHICIAGITRPEHWKQIVSHIPEKPNQIVIIESMVCHETLLGKASEYPKRFVSLSELRTLLGRHPNVLNLVRYSTSERSSVDSQLRRIIELCGPGIDGFQLELAWPDIEQLRRFLAMFPKKLVLKIGRQAYEDVGRSKIRLSSRLLRYHGLIQDIQLNLTEGSEDQFDPDQTLDLLKTLHVLPFGVGISGRLSDSTDSRDLERVLRLYPGVNISALRDLRSEADDFLPEKAGHFLDRLFRIIPEE
ncbi:MAG: hypothetical protein HGB37_03775 [Candidatus Moranbacteria bacterium]|nr:hypothetical protein [Candidatus Moranbacteria bacterium]